MRLNWTAEFLLGNSLANLPRYDAQAWLDAHKVDSSAAADRWCALLVDGAASGDTLKQMRALWASGNADEQLAALQVLLQSPEFQLA